MQQQVKNILNTQIDSLLIRAQDKLKNEGTKKILELKKELSSPQEIMKKLGIDINKDSCSEKGREKFNKKYNLLDKKLTKLENIIKNAKESLQDIDNQIKPISEEEGPLGQIKSLSQILQQTLLPILQTILLLAPILLGVLTGLLASVSAGDQIQKRRDKALSKIKEYSALVTVIPFMILFYVNKAEKVLKKLQPIILKLSEMEEQITKLKLFMYNFKLQYEDQCNKIDNTANLSIGNENNPLFPDPTGPTPLEEYLSLLNERYNDVYLSLKESNNEKAIEQIYAIKQNFEKDYNISFKVINLD